MVLNAEKRGSRYFVTFLGLEYEIILPEEKVVKKKVVKKGKK